MHYPKTVLVSFDNRKNVDTISFIQLLLIENTKTNIYQIFHLQLYSAIDNKNDHYNNNTDNDSNFTNHYKCASDNNNRKR